MAWSDGIEGVHRAIAGERRHPVHVLAGPGTGKTFAMMRRIARLLETGTEPHRILAVTFTRTAARDLSAQLVRLGSPGAENVTATTLHSLCFSILAKQEVFALTARTARPLMSFEIEQLVNDLARSFGGKTAVKDLIKAYEAAWARLQIEQPGGARSAEDLRFEGALLDWLRYHRAMLVGELVPVTLRFMRSNPQMVVLRRYEAVLVDEYQDLNRADQSLIEELARQGKLTVIGDDNQSIYSFRHANPEGIRVFPNEHPGTVPFVIQECRRCPPNIVSLSNALIGHDPLARQSPLAPGPVLAPANVTIVQHSTIEDESANVAAFIDHYLRTHPGIPPGQVLVLSPRRLMGNAVKDALIQRGRNALSYFWEDAVDDAAAAEGFCLLTLLVNPTDRAAYRAWLGIGHRDGHSSAYERLRAAAQAAGIEPAEACQRMVAGAVRLPHSAGIRARHQALQTRLAAFAGLEGLTLVNALWAGNDDATRAIRLAAQAIAVDAPRPADLLEELRTAITQPELPASDGEVIRVMSLHKSKGLTAALVVAVGCVSGAIPTVDRRLPPAEQDAQLREQRRLFYVAITRATDTLVLSSVTGLPRRTALRAGIDPGRGFGLVARIAASPFLVELGPDAPAAITGAEWRTAVGF